MSSTPRPSEVPGHDLAVATGLVPRIPATPPTPLRGRSAADTGRQALVRGVVAGVVAAVPFVAYPSAPTALLIMAFVGYVMHLFTWVGNRLLDELAQGYTTLTFTQGTFWFTLEGWVAWSFDGVWKLTTDGAVPPTPGTVDPPGLYPSPDKPGKWQVWTGSQWSGSHRPAPDPVPR